MIGNLQPPSSANACKTTRICTHNVALDRKRQNDDLSAVQLLYSIADIMLGQSNVSPKTGRLLLLEPAKFANAATGYHHLDYRH